MRIWDLFEEWILAARAANRSPNTIHNYRDHVTRFIRCLEATGKPTECEELTPGMIRQFIAETSEHYAPQTVRNNVKSLKTMFRFAVSEELLDTDPMRRVQLPKVPSVAVDSFTVEEIDTLLRACDRRLLLGIRDFAIVILLFDSGIRAAELVNLRDEDIDVDRAFVKVRGKGGKDRFVPVSARTLRAIKRYQRQRDAAGKSRRDCLFVNIVGEPLTRSGLLQMMYRLGKQTGLHVYPHKFRHSYAVNALRNGAREFDIQACLGHTTLTMTRHYARLALGDLAEAHKRFSPADRLRTRI